MRISVNAIVVGMAVCTTLFVFVNTFPNKNLLNYSIKEQLLDLVPSVGMSLLMFVCVYAMNYLSMNGWAKMILQFFVGVVIYIALSIITKNTEFKRIKDMCFNVGKRR